MKRALLVAGLVLSLPAHAWAEGSSGQTHLADVSPLVPGIRLARSATKAVEVDESDDTSKPSKPRKADRKIADTGDGIEEKADTWYTFIGARYQGTIVPKFWVNLFVDDGTTFYSNTVGVEAEFRKNHFSIIPSLSLTELGTDPFLVLEKNKPSSVVGNYSVIDSDLKIVMAQADFLWSVKMHKQLDFEFGFGVGLGMTFGDLLINWVREDPNGPYQSELGGRYSLCPRETDTIRGCSKKDHSNSPVARVNGSLEPSWFNGGAKPSFLPSIQIPRVGLRYKPSRNFVARLGLGWSAIGPWFGLSGSYGLGEAPVKKTNETVEVQETSE